MMSNYLYLYQLYLNPYNNEKQIYQLSILEDFLINVVVFCGLSNIDKLSHGDTYLLIESKEKLDRNNYYNTLYLYINLIQLGTGQSTKYRTILNGKKESVDNIIKKYLYKPFYHKEVSFGGVNEENTIEKVYKYTYWYPQLAELDKKKFRNSLNTFSYAEDLRNDANPHLKYSLYMTLFLSSINQLANNPYQDQYLTVCDKCGKSHSSTSHLNEVKVLIRTLLGGHKHYLSLVNELFHGLRSPFLHEGILSGNEEKGGFFNSSDPKYPENEINLYFLNRSLLEQYLLQMGQKNLSKNNS